MICETEFGQCHQRLKAAISAGRKILICGNGGSASQAQHFAAELVVRYMKDRPAWPAIALTADSAVLTAAANDLGYQYVFSRQIEALGQPDDVLVALSCSGKSPNVLEAIKAARAKNMHIIGLTGPSGMQEPCDIELRASALRTSAIQEWHLQQIHSLCEVLGA